MFALEHPGKMPSYIQESSNPSISVEGTSLCQDVTFSPCYSSACRKARAREVELGGWVQVARLCYSPYCRANPPPSVKRSYWKHPKIRALRARVRMVLALDVFKDLVNPFSSFVPRGVSDYFSRVLSEDEDATNWVVHCEVLQGAVLFADASGFTKLTELLARHNSAVSASEGSVAGAGKGAELLTGILNSFFKELVDIVITHGGDIIKFAGDAVTAVWFLDGDRIKDMTMACKMAGLCSNALHKKLHNFPAVSEELARQCGGDSGLFLSLHCGIGCGQLTCIHVGGVFKRWEYVLAGPPLTQMGTAEPLAESGETVVSPEVWAHLQNSFAGIPMSNFAEAKRSNPPSPEHYGFILLGKLKVEHIPENMHAMRVFRGDARKHVEFLKRYIPAAVHKQLEAGQDPRNLAEIRTLSIVFLKVEGVSLEAIPVKDGNPDVISALLKGQELMLTVQEIMYLWEGSVNKMTIDDKGLVFLCVFGLHPLYHTDDPRRAVCAAQMAIKRLPKLGDGVTVSVGVTTGPTFCGVVGSKRRREYTVMGMLVNLAARLMCSSPKNDILVDERTRNHSTTRMVFEEREPLSLKGIAEPQRNFRPVGEETILNSSNSEALSRLVLQFRSKELTQIEEILKTGSNGKVCVIIGDRGSGKTEVFEETNHIGTRLGYVVLNGKAEKRKGSTTFNQHVGNWESPKFEAWQPIFRALIKHGSLAEGLDQTTYLENCLRNENHLALMSVMMPELSLTVPERPTDTSLNASLSDRDLRNRTPGYWDLTDAERVSYMHRHLFRLLDIFSEKYPVLLSLYFKTGSSAVGAQDKESWQFAQHVAERIMSQHGRKSVNRIVMAITNRPSVYSSPNEFINIQKKAEETHALVTLTPLEKLERQQYLHDLVRSESDVTEDGSYRIEIPAAIIDFVSRMGAGNLKHIKELVDVLKKNVFVLDDDDRIVVDEHKVLLKPGMEQVGAIDQVEIPMKTKGAVKFQLEQLLPRPREVVKYACACTTFTPHMLMELVPDSNMLKHHNVDSDLEELVSSGILEEVNVPPELAEFHSTKPERCFRFVSELLRLEAQKFWPEGVKEDIEKKLRQMETRQKAWQVEKLISSSIKHKFQNWLGLKLDNDEFKDKYYPTPFKKQTRIAFRIPKKSSDANDSLVLSPEKKKTRVSRRRSKSERIPARFSQDDVSQMIRRRGSQGAMNEAEAIDEKDQVFESFNKPEVPKKATTKKVLPLALSPTNTKPTRKLPSTKRLPTTPQRKLPPAPKTPVPTTALLENKKLKEEVASLKRQLLKLEADLKQERIKREEIELQLKGYML
eukprot:m.6119 g.6119  ORF g.6119 m.6119 type:complete len:1303 (-) comp3487_c0_seq1:443-4351(-)